MEQEKFAQQEAKVAARFQSTQDSLKKEIEALQESIVVKTNQRNDLVRIAQEEADGTGGSKKKNPGPIYKIKKNDADQAERELLQLSEINKPKINSLERQIVTNDLTISNEIKSWDRQKMNGPAARMEALARLTTASSAIWWAQWFIVLLFIAIETSPVFVKLISSRGPYDHLVKIEEHTFFVQETETLAKINAEAKDRTATLPQHERTFINDRLDASLRRS
jgi:hypothetical protein